MPTVPATEALDRAFFQARTFQKFTDQAIDDATLHQLHEAFKWGPTSMNCQPARLAADTAMRNSSLQGAYLIIAARLLGLDAGPMSGFDPATLNEAFFPDSRWKANFLVNLGIGDAQGNHPRGPRLAFDEVARIA